jgi:Nucleosome assembly protein (NAP)
VKKTVPTESFFNFFNPPKAPTDSESVDSEDDIEERLELDYTIGEDIKEKLIPHAVSWFTGEALQFEELDDEELGEGDSEDDDDEDDDDDEEDSRDEEEESADEVCFSTPIRCAVNANTFRTMPQSQSRRRLSVSRARYVLHRAWRRGGFQASQHEA